MDAEHYRLRDFLTRTAQPYEWHEAGSAEADLLLENLGPREATLPVLVDGDQNFTAATVEPVGLAGRGRPQGKRWHHGLVVLARGPRAPGRAGSTCTAPTRYRDTASTTGRAAAKQRNAVGRAWLSSAPATPPAKRCSTSRTRRPA